MKIIKYNSNQLFLLFNNFISNNKYLFIIVLITMYCSCSTTKKYEKAKASRSIQVYEAFITKNPKSKHLNQAKNELAILHEENDWNSTKKADIISAYQWFLSKYPNSKYGTQCEIRIKKIQEDNDWLKALNINAVYSYENFINAYPSSHYVFDAKNKIQKLKENNAWNEAERIGTMDSYRNYISNFPDGSNKSLAYDKIREIEIVLPAWNNAKKANSLDAYKTFIFNYGGSSYASYAKQKIREIEFDYWNQAENKKSIAGYQKYLAQFPNGEHRAEAEKAIIDIEVDNIFKGDHGQLPPMNKNNNGSTNSTTNEIEIYNNTVYTLLVRYSGQIESTKIVLLPKQKYSFSLNNGEYRVAASVDAPNVSNYAGKEKLIGGNYTSEFYIETKTYRR